ncbi:MAG TPA: glycosyltransferase family 2 protein, partial [Edaphobacter sp.]|nr:glycosyltransferase family 2 protein [Edaphobacter sp.]
MKISATIITFNEERNIARVIESLRCCDEILVLDSGSNDRTEEIAVKLGARVVDASWRGYATQKNLAAELATHDWILALDADESLSEA